MRRSKFENLENKIVLEIDYSKAKGNLGKLIALCVRAGTISRSKTHLKMVFPESRSEAITPKSKPKARLSEVKTNIEGESNHRCKDVTMNQEQCFRLCIFVLKLNSRGGERLDRSMDFLSEVELLDLNILTTNLFQEQIGNFRETSKLLNFVRPKLPQLYQ